MRGPSYRARVVVTAVCVVLAGVGMAWSAQGTAPGRYGVRWAVDTTYVYDVRYDSNGETTVPALLAGMWDNPGAQPLATKYEGQMEETVWRRHPDGVDLLVQWVPHDTARATQCLAHLGAAGQVQALTFAADTSAAARQMLRTVMSATQVTWATAGAPQRWCAAELDLTGSWCADYIVGAATDAELPFSKQPGGGQTVTGLQVRRKGRLDGALSRPAGHLLRLGGATDTEFWDGARMLGQDHVAVTLTLREMRAAGRRESEDAAALARPVAGASQRMDLADDEAYRPVRQTTLRNAIGDTKLSELRDAYLRAPDGSHQVLLAMSVKLDAYLELDPPAAGEVAAALLAELDADSPAFSSVGASLTYVGNAECQAVLRRAIAARAGDVRAVRRLLTHLAMVAHPEAASEEVLQSLARQTADRGVFTSAQLGLGIMGHAFLATDPGRADRIFAAAAASLADGDDVPFRLRVLGNLGHPRQVEVVANLLASAAPALRGPALYSLRFVNTAAAQQELLSAAINDRDEDARLAATQALGWHPATPQRVAALREQLSHEQAVPVLREVLRDLSHAASTSPAAAEALADFRRRCAHPDLCHFAEGLEQING